MRFGEVEGELETSIVVTVVFHKFAPAVVDFLGVVTPLAGFDLKHHDFLALLEETVVFALFY